MELNEAWVSTVEDGEGLAAYLVRPAAVREPLPAVLVLMEIWGVDEHIRDICRRLATAGYAALAPDLYARGGKPEALQEERIEAVKAFLDRQDPRVWWDRSALEAALAQEAPDKAQAIGETLGRLFGSRDVEGYVRQVVAWSRWLAEAPFADGQRQGSIGFCLGGQLSFALATHGLPQHRVALVFYGAAPEPAAMAGIRCPVVGFYGETDHRLTDAVPDVRRAMAEAGKSYEAYVYRGAGHAFMNDTRRSYHPAAARDAWARALSALAAHLGGDVLLR
jgi:carboxymethylenebutenolidase